MRKFLLLSGLAWCTAVMTALPAVARPEIENLDLIATDRTSETVFDYTFRIRLRGDSNSYSGLVITVHPPNGPTGTAVIQGVIPVGRLDANGLSRPDTLLKIRQDRMIPFNFKALIIQIDGKTDPYTGQTGKLTISSVVLLEKPPNAMHGGTFPLLGDSPVIGQRVGIRANILGPVNSVTYRLVTKDARVLAQGEMGAADGAPTVFYAVFDCPLDPFTLELRAAGPLGIKPWVSTTTYRPASLRFSVMPDAVLLSKGQLSKLTLSVQSVAAVGRYKIKLFPPSSVVVTQADWSINLLPGQTNLISVPFATPLAGETMSKLPFLVELTRDGESNPITVEQVLYVQ